LVGPKRRVRPHPQTTTSISLCPENPIGFAMVALDVVLRPRRCKVIDHQQGILRLERQTLERIAGADPGCGQVARIQTGTEVLLHQRRQGGLSRSGRSAQVQAKIDIADDGPPDRSVQWESDSPRSKGEELKTRANAPLQQLPLGWNW